MQRNEIINALVVVAHPDDETLWAGGTILMHPGWKWTIVSLCRAGDKDRAPKFKKAVEQLHGSGRMGDLDDGPEQSPLSGKQVEKAILSLLPVESFDLLMTHSPYGEYTRHRRHEETGMAVAGLWKIGQIKAGEVWMFAYRDNGKGGKDDLPQAIDSAHLVARLPGNIWKEKYRTITEVYGFGRESYEARVSPKVEAFWRFSSPVEYDKWLAERGKQ